MQTADMVTWKFNVLSIDIMKRETYSLVLHLGICKTLSKKSCCRLGGPVRVLVHLSGIARICLLNAYCKRWFISYDDILSKESPDAQYLKGFSTL